ncbi:MAG: nicotinamide mononucleotide transporter, partial [Gemmatimonadetes bacterium]|nr:nicotinamide mononucleotide transporter [Gemmatimonadota bacterium]
MSFSWQEWLAAACFLASVWLLARNRPLGWWIGLVGSLLYIWIFTVVWLPGEIMIQVYFVATSLWGIWMWLRGGEGREEKPITRASPRLM